MTQSGDVASLVERLWEPCRDYTGEMIGGGSTPRYEIHCDLLYEAASTLASLQEENDALKSERANLISTKRDQLAALTTRAERAEAQLKAARDALATIRELNMSGADANGPQWANSDLIEQEIVAALQPIPEEEILNAPPPP